MDSNVDKYFHVVDFIIFGLVLFLSATIGVLFAYRDRKNQSTENYYFGNKKVSPIPVAISLAVSFVSAITVIGIPVEVYLYGGVFIWILIALFFAALFAGVYFIPLYHRLQPKSVYEYLERRFDKKVRHVASAMSVLNMVLYMGITIYVPSLALSAVTPLNLTWTIALTSIICTFYTSIGGMKAVIWTDVLQGLVMFGGMIAVLIQGLIVVGGVGKVSEALKNGGRDNFLIFDLDPRIRSTTFSVGIGFVMNYSYKSCCNQVFCQRYLACKNKNSAQIAIGLKFILGSVFLTLISVCNGLVMYTYYQGCDPLLAGEITKVDQSMPRFAVELFQNVPGLAGLFVSAAFSGTLSTVSSGVNSLSALLLEDFILVCFPKLSSRKTMLLSKILSLGFGLLVMTLAYVVSLLSSNIVQVTVSINGCIGGAIVSAFIMGMFLPWINTAGALTGMLAGFGCSVWIALAGIFHANFPDAKMKLPVSVENCSTTDSMLFTHIYNHSQYITTPISTIDMSGEEFTTQISIEESPVLYYTLYSISPFFYGWFGFFISLLVGHLVSLVTGFNKPSKANPDLFVPIANFKILRFGVPEIQENTFDSDEIQSMKSQEINGNERDSFLHKMEPPLQSDAVDNNIDELT